METVAELVKDRFFFRFIKHSIQSKPFPLVNEVTPKMERDSIRECSGRTSHDERDPGPNHILQSFA